METTLSHNDDEITVAQFERWFEKSRPGSSFVYHRGNLMIDREDIRVIPALGKVARVVHEPVNTLGELAWAWYERGYVELVQWKQPGSTTFQYIAFKRKTRRHK